MAAACLLGTGSACSIGHAGSTTSGAASTTSGAASTTGPAFPASATLPPGPSTSATAQAPVREICLQAPPASWRRVLAAGTMPVRGPRGFSVGAVSSGLAFGWATSDAGGAVVMLDLASGAVTRIASLPPTAGGVSWMSVELPWVVWTQADSTTDLFDWSVHAWNRSTGRTRTLATSAAPGGRGESPGQQPLPVIFHGSASWAQPIGRPGTSVVVSRLRLVDLASGRSRTFAEGRLSSPVVAGPDLVWASMSSSGRFDLHAVDAMTTAAVTLPTTLSDPGSVGFLGGSADTLAWSSSDGTRMTVWSRRSGTRRVFTSEDGIHFFQFLQLAGPFLAWFAAGSSAIMDLRTGAGFAVTGSVAASRDDLVVAPMTVRKAAAPVAGTVSRVRLSSAPPLAACEGRTP